MRHCCYTGGRINLIESEVTSYQIHSYHQSWAPIMEKSEQVADIPNQQPTIDNQNQASRHQYNRQQQKIDSHYSTINNQRAEQKNTADSYTRQ
jgi:hypothetical protein